MYLCMYVCIYVCMCVCVCVCMCVCIHIYIYIQMIECFPAELFLWIKSPFHEWNNVVVRYSFVFMYVMHVCYVCMSCTVCHVYIYIYVCMYACMYVYTIDIDRSPADLSKKKYISFHFPFTNGTIGAMRFILFCMIRRYGDGLLYNLKLL